MSDSGPVSRQAASSRAVVSGGLGDSAVPAAGCHSASASYADPNTLALATVRIQHESMSHAYQWSGASPS